MNLTYLFVGIILLLFGLVMGYIYLYGKKHNSSWMDKFSKSLLISSIILVPIGLILFIASFFDNTPNTPGTPKKVSQSPVLIGNALVYDGNNKINLSQIINNIDIFWDWRIQYDIDGSIYDVPASSITDSKFIPMVWCAAGSLRDKDSNLITLNKNTKYMFSWNEPDMLGTVMGWNKKIGDILSSCGFLSNNVPYYYDKGNLLVYGNMIKGGIDSITAASSDDKDTMYTEIASVLYNQATDIKNQIPNVKLATPVMAMDADISLGCSGYSPLTSGTTGGCIDSGASTVQVKENTLAIVCSNCDQTGGICKGVCNGVPLDSNCKNTCYLDINGKKRDGCFCNGWLSLVKNADINNQWWNKCDIINIHAYGRYAHSIKLKLIGYMYIFPEIIKRTYNPNTKTYSINSNGPELWLTECACVPTPKDLTSLGAEKINASFIRDLLWYDTSITDDMSKNCSGTINSYGAPNYLPGLRTMNTFTYQGKTGSWYEHGFGAFTWFTGMLNGFDVGCGEYVGSINASIWDTNYKLNDVWTALTVPPNI